MELLKHLSLLTPLDVAAFALVLGGWLGIGWLIEHPTAKRPSVSVIMSRHRHAWMRVFVGREPRIFDSQILASLRQSTSFFASTSIFAIGGVLALMGNPEVLSGAVAEVTAAALPAVIWQLKLGLVALFLTNGFLKFVWANRVFGYCAVVMASVPNDPQDALAYPTAEKAAALNVRAAMSFNQGLRALYFALGCIAWLVGPVPLMLATVVVLWTLWSREFASQTRDILLRDLP